MANDFRAGHAPPTPALTNSRCEAHRAYIDVQLQLCSVPNAMGFYLDLVDLHGFDGAYHSFKRFCARLRHKEPEQFDRLSFCPSAEMQLDYDGSAATRVQCSDRWRKPRLFVAKLHYSRCSFRRMVWEFSQKIWAKLHEHSVRRQMSSRRPQQLCGTPGRNRLRNDGAAVSAALLDP